MVSGEDEITSFREDGERYPVKMRVRENQRNDVEAIGSLMVASSRGNLVRIDNLARLERGDGPTSITRLDRAVRRGRVRRHPPGLRARQRDPVVRARSRS